MLSLRFAATETEQEMKLVDAAKIKFAGMQTRNRLARVAEGGPGARDGPVDPEAPTSCEITGNYCVSDRWACLEKGGQSLSEGEFACVSHVEFCCTVPVENENNAKTCFELGGSVCRSDETCSS